MVPHDPPPARPRRRPRLPRAHRCGFDAVGWVGAVSGLARVAALESQWSAALDAGCPWCGPVDDCDHIEGANYALADLRALLAAEPQPEGAPTIEDVLRWFGEDCARSIEAMAQASQYGPHRRAGMLDAAARVRQRANEWADDPEDALRQAGAR